MPDQLSESPSAPTATAAPVLFLHAGGSHAPPGEWIDALRGLGLDVLGRDVVRDRGDSSMTDIGALCAASRSRAGDAPLIVVRAPLTFDEHALRRVTTALAANPEPLALTAFSNADADLNPFAGQDDTADAADPAALVALLGRGEFHRLETWPGHFVALNPAAVALLADHSASRSNSAGLLRRGGGRLALYDRLYLHDPGADLGAAPKLEPHESPRPVAWGALSERLTAWLSAPPSADDLPSPNRPVTLHVTHSWGGGVATWVNAYIDADRSGTHFQLRSEGPQTGQGAGQKLALYLGNHLDVAIDEWWLQPPIRTVDAANQQYRAVLERVISRFGVGRVFVSSLVGHALDALEAGPPTVQVLHDHFPAWPLLGVHPAEYGADLAPALADPRAQEPFPDTSLDDWTALAERYRDVARGVQLVAPSRSVVDVQSSLAGDWNPDDIRVIPHGLPPLPVAAPVAPKSRADGRLRLLIPGRVQSGKGAELLDRVLDRLTAVAQVYLLGTGKGGERFFGRAGVNVVLEYRREELPDLLATIGPHVAALLSVVPETFSYTLSEMRALGIPVIATDVGAFRERIRDGETGWLIDPVPEALADMVETLSGEPARIEAMRAQVRADPPRSVADMVADYDALCPAVMTGTAPPRPEDMPLDRAQAASWRAIADRRGGALANERRIQAALRHDVEERTAWAQDVQAELTRVKDQLGRELVERARHIEHLDGEIERARATIGELESTVDTMLNSHSWRVTRPLRAGRRMYASLRRARAWNPLRWPWLLAQLGRNLSTHGVSGTVGRMQHFETRGAPTTKPAPGPLSERGPVELPAKLPTSDTPLVSVVVPVYNHFDHTAACLASLANARCEAPFEVIVADDASSDDTPERLRAVEGLRYSRAEDNLGFIGNCNRAAAEARGEFVCFLNNDTEVLDGWLDALVDVFERRADAGLVGARLVYPDGRLQECGGLVFNDGTGWNYGRGDEPDRPQYQYLRETDYCSGACLAIRRSMWEDLGGFDERYAPAYYEDTDLAFRVRERGLKVYVQPLATVIHHEGVTSGTDLQSGVKRFQSVNRKKFLDRWAEALADQPAPLSGPGDAAGLRRARDHRLRGRVLLVDAYTPEPDQDSGSVRLVQLMRCLDDMGYGVTFFADNRAHAGRYTTALQAAGVETWYDPWLASPTAFLRDHGRDFDMVFVSRHYVAVHYLSALRKWAPQARFVLDTVDLHYLREQRQAELEDSPALIQAARQTRRAELAVIRAADATLVVSEVERDVLADDAPGCPVFVLSNIHDLADDGPGFGDRTDLYFVGGYQHPPNIDAAKWFVDDIWPRIRTECPDVRFHLVGSKAPGDVAALGERDGVVFHGFVEDMAPFLNGCRLSVAPLRYGAGVKGKVNQAMAHGQPVVATTVAVEGLHAEDGRDVLVADDAESFARAVIRLYGDATLWNILAEGGRDNVRKHFSREAARRDIETLLNALADDG